VDSDFSPVLKEVPGVNLEAHIFSTSASSDNCAEWTAASPGDMEDEICSISLRTAFSFASNSER